MPVLDRGRFMPDTAADEQRNDPGLEPVAHPVASLGRDFLMRGTGLRRGGVNHGVVGC
jgi:formate dehydrogenase maturation protein FdhE